MKISCNTYKTTYDCTNNGVSSRINDFILVSTDEVKDYTPDQENVLVFTSGPYDTLRAVPLKAYLDNTWVMFGGNFVFTSDSRFPSDQPIKIFDRIES